MQGLKGLIESVASGFDILYNATLPLDIFLSLHHGNHSLATLLWPTYTNVLFLSFIMLFLFVYYYIWLPINWFQDTTDVGYPHIKGRRPKKVLVEEIQRRKQLGEMPPVYPNGWFALLESTDLKAGQVKHVQALGENFAVMRSRNGKVHVLDAYCPHLGANMAVGGVVKGDCLECPFHGWQFRGEDGACSHIPYSDKVPKSAAVKKWTSNEVNGFVFVWYHAEGEPPSWQVESIPEMETGKLTYCGRTEIFINCHIQDIAENSADLTHFEAIHKPSIFAGSDIRSLNRLTHSFMKHDWTGTWTQHSTPGEKHIGTLRLTHTLRLFDKFTLMPSDLSITQIGPGYDVVKNEFGYVCLTLTPVEPLMMRMVYHVYVRSPLFYFIGRISLYAWLTTIERDVMVWQYKKFQMKPKLVKEEEGIIRFRRWYSQFYTENSPRFSFKQDSTEW